MIARAYEQWRVDPRDIEGLNAKLHRLGLKGSLPSNEYDDKGEHGDTSEDSDDTDGYLPELSVDFQDPEGSYFEELLRWVTKKPPQSSPPYHPMPLVSA